MAKNTYKAGKQDKKPDKKALPKGLIRLAVLLVSVVVMLGAAFGASWLIQGNTRQPENIVPSTTSRNGAQPGGEAQSNKNTNIGDEWNDNGPVLPGSDGLDLVAPDYRMIAVPENGVVDESFYGTVTMIGDSLSQGFGLWAGTEATVCAYKGISPRAIYDGTIQTNYDGEEQVPMDAIVASQPDYVYILMGANAILNMQDASFIEYYRTMLDELQAALHPDVQVYIQSLTPVRPGNTAEFDQERIDSLNDQLAKLAWEEDVYFIDLTETLKDGEGYLKEEYAATDGYHMNEQGYYAWRDYLLTHTVHHPRLPYLPGSPYYVER